MRTPNNLTAWSAHIAGWADQIIWEIADDMATGKVPVGTADFGSLHNCADANMYLLAVVPESITMDMTGWWAADMWNAVCNAVSERLANGAAVLVLANRAALGRSAAARAAELAAGDLAGQVTA